MTESLRELSAFARELAARARHETSRHGRGPLRVEDKHPDGVFDPVTEADRAAETAMRELITERYPEHGIAGEEFPDKPSAGQYIWSLDPIDGTRSYMCGLPTWATLIALLDDEAPVLGLIDAPRLDETYVGSGDQAHLTCKGEESKLSVSGCTRLAEARFSTTDPFLFGPAAAAIQPVLHAVRVTRFGHDAYAYARLAAGDLDLVVECGLKPHDYNALIPIVRGAGGHFGDWRGGRDFAAGNVIAAASRELYEATVELLAGA